MTARHPVELGFVDQEARIDGRRIARHAQPQAGRAAAIGHRLADIDELDPADRAVARRGGARASAHTDGVSRHSVGATSVIAPSGGGDQLGVEQIGSDRVGERRPRHRRPRRNRTRRRAAASASTSGRLSANAFSCANSTGPLATATTSLWNAPAAIASSDCSANRVRSGSSAWRRATAFDASRCWRAGKAPPVTP